jgi:hypothetical protein
MITIITIDDDGRVVERRDECEWLTEDIPIGDRIFIRPDWPPIGDPAFADRLREWHAQHNDTELTTDN